MLHFYLLAKFSNEISVINIKPLCIGQQSYFVLVNGFFLKQNKKKEDEEPNEKDKRYVSDSLSE